MNQKSLQDAASHLSTNDRVLAKIISRAGLATITPNKNYYQELVQSIISQQLSVKASATILSRFIGLFKSDTFPTPHMIVAKELHDLRSAGLSRQKADYIQDLAHKVISGVVQFDHLDSLENDEIIDELTQIKGVGVWTVHMFLIFCMGRTNVLPVGDLGIKNGIQKLYNLENLPTQDEIRKIADAYNWHPYESVASWYVWHSLDNKPLL